MDSKQINSAKEFIKHPLYLKGSTQLQQLINN